MSVTVYSEVTYPTHVRRRYEVTLTDNLGDDHVYVPNINNYQPADDGSEVEAQQLASVKAQEIQQWIQEMERGLDPWHTSPFINSVPLWNTWDIAASESLKHWLLMDYRQELLNCDFSVSGTSNNDLTDLLISTSSTFSQTDLRAEIQQAVDTQVDLDTYVPSVTEGV